MNTQTSNTGMTVEQILSKKGPKPRLEKHIAAFLSKHSARIPSAELDAVIATLTNQRNANLQAESDFAKRQADIAMAKANELAAKVTPVVPVAPVAA